MTQLVVVAQGIEIRDEPASSDLQDLLTASCDRKGAAPAAGAANTWLYPKGPAARATHEIQVVYEQAALATALDTPDALVVYEGHSRYGQGPAFAPSGTPTIPDKKAFPVNPWGVHFRMGYDATDTECVDDLLHHSVTPTEFNLLRAPASSFLPAELQSAAAQAKAQATRIKAARTRAGATCGLGGAWRAMDVCEPARAATVTSRGDVPLKGRHYYRHRTRRPEEFFTAVAVGSADLRKSSLACRLFFVASCSSHVHFFEPMTRRRKAAKSRCTFLLTAQVCSSSHARTFLRQVLLKRRDPTTARGLKAIVRALNGEIDSGLVGIY